MTLHSFSFHRLFILTLAGSAALIAACGGDVVGSSGGGGGTNTGGSANTGGGTTTGGGASPTSCQAGGSTDLPGVSIEITSPRCVFTVAEAKAGISIPYRVVVANDIPDVIPTPQDWGECDTPGPSGLTLFEELSGSGQQYCFCDVGPCAGTSTPTTVKQGSYSETFDWHGFNWTGPSDTDNPSGPFFPPGAYTLEVSAKGTHLGQPFEVKGTFTITLTP